LDTTADMTSPADPSVLCFGFSDPAAPVLRQITEGRRLLSAHDGGQAAASVLIAKGEGCAEALSFAARYSDVVETVVLMSPDGPAVRRAAEIASACKAQVLVLAGTLDAAGGSAGTALKKTLPACHLVYVFDAGKDIDAERPAALAKVARDFLARRDKFLVSNADGRLTP
jgi:pimeloyl-ACP methyl ester carboxylesterase